MDTLKPRPGPGRPRVALGFALLGVVAAIAAALVAASAAPAKPCSLRLVINVPAFRLYAYRDGVLWRDYPIAVGRAASPSFEGVCRVVSKLENPTWYPPDKRPPVPPGPDNPLGTRWLGLSVPGYGIHGNNNPRSIGRAVSLGCIRMLEPDVRELFGVVAIGTPVEFRYETVVTGVDPSTGQASLTVYRDIYGRAANDPARVAERVTAAFGWRPFSVSLCTVLAEQAGLPRPVPRAVSLAAVTLDGPARPGVVAAHAPLSPAREVGFAECPFSPSPDCVWIRVRSVAEALGAGLSYSAADRGALETGAPAGARYVGGRLLGGRLFVRLSDLAAVFPRSIGSVSTRPDPAGPGGPPLLAGAAAGEAGRGTQVQWDAAACVLFVVRPPGGVPLT